MKGSPDTYPYPHKFNVQYNLTEFINNYKDKTKTNEFLEEQVNIAGRITNIRASGKSLVFYDIQGNGENFKFSVMLLSTREPNHLKIPTKHSEEEILLVLLVNQAELKLMSSQSLLMILFFCPLVFICSLNPMLALKMPNPDSERDIWT